jgi:Dipeptide/tripeptide permease
MGAMSDTHRSNGPEGEAEDAGATATTTAPTDSSHGFFGQPRSLANIFGVEMWERFSFYGMQGILLIYLYYSAAKGGLGVDQATAAGIVGAYGRGRLPVHDPRRVAGGPALRVGAGAVLECGRHHGGAHLARGAAELHRGDRRPPVSRRRQRRLEGERDADRRDALQRARLAARRGVLAVLPRHQPGRVLRAAAHRAAADDARVPLRVRARRSRDGDRPHPVLAGSQAPPRLSRARCRTRCRARVSRW